MTTATKQVTKFDRATVRELDRQIEAALQGVAKDFGVSISTKNSRFSPDTISMKLEIARIGENGEIHSQAAQDFKWHADNFGLDPKDLGRTFCAAGRVYKITGLRPRAKKYPVLCTRAGTSRPVAVSAMVARIGLGKTANI